MAEGPKPYRPLHGSSPQADESPAEQRLYQRLDRLVWVLTRGGAGALVGVAAWFVARRLAPAESAGLDGWLWAFGLGGAAVGLGLGDWTSHRVSSLTHWLVQHWRRGPR